MLPTKNLRLSTRKSLLLAPNTIKDWHVKNRLEQNKSILPQFGISALDSKSRQYRISDGLEGCLFPVKNTNAHINSVIPEKSNKTSVIQHTSSQTFNMNNQSGVQNLNSTDLDLLTTSNENVLGKQIPRNLNCIEILDANTYNSQNSSITINQLSSTYDMETKLNADLYNSNNTDNNQDNIHCVDQSVQTTYTLLDTEQLKDSACSIHVEQERHLSTTARICRKDWHLSLQTIKTMSESFAHLQHDTEESNSHVTLSKTGLTVLQSNLKHLICRLEEDLSCLKLISTLIANTLFEANVTNKASENNETKIKHLATKNLNNTEEVDNVKTESPSMLVNNLTSKNIITDSDNIVEETCKSSDVTSDFLENDVSKKYNSEMQSLQQIDIASEHDKENKEILNTPLNVKRMKPKSETRRRSARLMEKTASKLNVTNDSFVNLEDELNIMNVQSNATPKLLKECTTPANKNKDKKVGRPLREYMALKSRMSCLLTPNMKRFHSLESKSNACADTGGTKASLSNKVLAELHNLYADSPET
nr:PREDICTED: ras guanine nucleotide exchange factor B-like [Linepithema humile]